MIYQEAPRKSLKGININPDKGFWLEGKDYADCIKQLKEYGSAHPEKWIYFYDCGLGPAYPVPVARNLFEVSIYDAEPAALMLFFKCFQEGYDKKREIDMMSEEQRTDFIKKRLCGLYLLGSSFLNQTK